MYVNDVELSEGQYILPGVKIIDNAIDNPQELIDIANSSPDNWHAAGVGHEGEIDSEVRKANTFPVPVHFSNPLAFFTVMQKVYLYVRQFADENAIEFSHMEQASLLEYLEGDGFYLPHLDAGPYNPRAISAVLYLNDVEEGGETYFDRFDSSISPVAGRLVIFPSTFPYSHEARNPKVGNKYAIVTWFAQPLDQQSAKAYYGWQ